MPNKHPPEVVRILNILPEIPPGADVETTIELLFDPPRKADAYETERPETRPRFYMNIDDKYRLAVDFRNNVSHQTDGTVVIGQGYFEGARVQVVDELGNWSDVYPIRTKHAIQRRRVNSQ